MGHKGAAFTKGGVGCLVAFFVVALIAVLVGGNVHIDIGGAICLFVGGGLLGLLILWIYNRGRTAGQQNRDRDDSAF